MIFTALETAIYPFKSSLACMRIALLECFNGKFNFSLLANGKEGSLEQSHKSLLMKLIATSDGL